MSTVTDINAFRRAKIEKELEGFDYIDNPYEFFQKRKTLIEIATAAKRGKISVEKARAEQNGILLEIMRQEDKLEDFITV